MSNKILCFLLFFTLLCGKISASDCILNDTSWSKLHLSIKLRLLIEQSSGVGQECFCNILEELIESNNEKKTVDSLAVFVKKWADKNQLGTEVLFRCYKNEKIYKRYPLWPAILSGWMKDNQSIDQEFVNLVKKGQHFRADTLFRILDIEGKLDYHDWLRWAKVKNIISDINSIAGLYCRALQKEPDVSDVALHQFGRILDEMEVDTAKKILHQFYNCSLSRQQSDSLSVLLWLADTYSKLELYQQEILILKLMQKSGFQVAYRLFDAARLRFTANKFSDAIEAASLCYQSADRGNLKSMAATIIYKSYINLEVPDSASMWINRADLGSNYENRIEAISFYQNNGDFSSAAKQIDSLPNSLARDTFTIRQHLLMGEIKKASTYVFNEKIVLNKNEKSASLWKIRVLLFSGNVKETASLLDSSEIEPFWEYAAELIWYQYWIQLLENSHEALAAWAKIEYNLFIGNYYKIMDVFKNNQVPKEYLWQLGLHVSKICMKKGLYDQALEFLKFGSGNDVSSEFYYYKAEALFRIGENDSATQIFNKIMLERSADPFSEKARMFVNEYGL